ncbi:MAG: D-glycero-beta-D-manno-heptose-7-phosphate kinase [Deltaproteobacteria bacterium]|nr:D-glycero-beta-D-manno-heptose-7-phosphate kinase [Deltaproteobacteria bacterium]
MIQEMSFADNGDKLIRCIDGFSKTRVLVLGDIIMDEYIWGDVSRISPEAPVPVVDVTQETKMLGGAANVVNNIAALGGRPILCGVVGRDRTGKEIIQKVKELGISAEGIIQVFGRPTTIKTRIVAQSQQVVRIDRECRNSLDGENMRRLLSFIESNKERVNAVLVSDYDKGVVSTELMEGLKTMCRGSRLLLGVDPKPNHFHSYQGIDVITPNHHEAGAFYGTKITDQESLVQAGNYMLVKLKCRSVLITQGKDGMTLFEENGEITHIPTVARKVFDVTGAGDTVVSAFCLSLAAGTDLKSAATIANFAAGIVVGEVGTSAVKAQDLTQVIRERLRRGV